MRKIKRKKRALTLLEIMIVIVLIGLIGSAIGVNMKGSLDEGRAFKTKQAKAQIEDILTLEVARGTAVDEVIRNRVAYLENSGLVKDGRKTLKDGWGQEFEVRAGRAADSIVVVSEKLKSYERKKAEKRGVKAEEADAQEE